MISFDKLLESIKWYDEVYRDENEVDVFNLEYIKLDDSIIVRIIFNKTNYRIQSFRTMKMSIKKDKGIIYQETIDKSDFKITTINGLDIPYEESYFYEYSDKICNHINRLQIMYLNRKGKNVNSFNWLYFNNNIEYKNSFLKNAASTYGLLLLDKFYYVHIINDKSKIEDIDPKQIIAYSRDICDKIIN